MTNCADRPRVRQESESGGSDSGRGGTTRARLAVWAGVRTRPPAEDYARWLPLPAVTAGRIGTDRGTRGVERFFWLRGT
jgi:hypothetical protein